MKSPFVGTLVPNEIVTAQFLVISKEIRQKKTGEPYLSMHLADRTGEIEARMWDNVPDIMDTFDRDDFVKVKGLLQVYQNRSQFTVHRLRRLEDHEVTFGDFFPCSERDPEEMYSELQRTIANFTNPHLRSLLESVFADARLAELYKVAPAAKTIHHACRGGLIEHVLSLCTLARLTAAHYKDVDLDLLLAGVILHDIGKVEELSYTRSFGYSAEGQLLGHIVIGLRVVGGKIDQIPDFPAKLRTLLEHMIISHHGELEFGSPKVPIFREALLLHHLDNLDSKMDAIRSAFKRDQLLEGEFTGWVASLERVLLRKDRYLNESKAPVEPTPAENLPQPQAPIHVETTPVPPRPTPPVIQSTPVPAHPIPGPPLESTPLPPRPTPAPPIQNPLVPAHPVPEPRPAQPERKPENRPVPVTLFGEKLQAVLESKK